MGHTVAIHPTRTGSKECAKVELQDASGTLTQLYVDFTTFLQHARRPTEDAADFLLVASIVYALDRLVLRSAADDGWRRSFAVDLPVANVAAWRGGSADITTALEFLTGDHWEISFVQRQHSFVRRKTRSRHSRRPCRRLVGEKVSLFSGGLDSLAGTIDCLHAYPQESLALVGHHDPYISGPLSDQENVYGVIRQNYESRLFPLFMGVGHKPSGDEITTRSRSLLFIALGVLAANALGEGTPLFIPENGTIALNVPLTPARRGSCSTRTAHPFFLQKVQTWLTAVGLQHPLRNPLLGKTKGEVITSCRDQALLQAAVPQTVSCAKRGHNRTWINRNAKGCGRCMPCIYRRAALHKSRWDNEIYGVDVCNGEVNLADPNGEAADDLRACMSFVRRNATQQDIAKMLVSSGPIAASEALLHADTVVRAMEEIRSLFRDKGTPALRRAMGL